MPTGGDTVIVARLPGGPGEVIVPRPLALGGLRVGEGGRLRGDSVTVTGRMTWSGGEIHTPLHIAAGARAELVGADDKNLYPPALTNAGTVVVRGAGRFRLWYEADVVNAGTFELQTTPEAPLVRVASIRCCTDPSRFVNTGTLVVSGADTLWGVRFVNRGEVRVAAGGVLSLNPGLYRLDPGTRLTGGRLRVGGSEDSVGTRHGVRLENASTLELARYSDLFGTLSASGASTVAWTGGTEGTLNVARGTRLRVRGPDQKVLSAGSTGWAGTSANAGTATWADTGRVTLQGRCCRRRHVDGRRRADRGRPESPPIRRTVPGHHRHRFPAAVVAHAV